VDRNENKQINARRANEIDFMPGKPLLDPRTCGQMFRRSSKQTQLRDEFAVRRARWRRVFHRNRGQGSTTVVVGLTRHHGNKLRMQRRFNSRVPQKLFSSLLPWNPIEPRWARSKSNCSPESLS